MMRITKLYWLLGSICIWFFLPLKIYATPCGMPNAVAVPGQNGNYYAAWSQSNLTFNIPLTAYPTYITAALTGNPLPTAQGTMIAIPACISISSSNNSFKYSSLTQEPVGVKIYANKIWPGGNNLPSVINVPLNENSNYAIGAEIAYYCPCGASSGGTSCPDYFYQSPLPVGDFILGHYYSDGGSHSHDGIGICEDSNSAGALIFSILAPPGEIPPVGTYETQIQIGIGPSS